MLSREAGSFTSRFDTNKPLELMIDGEKFSIKDDEAVTDSKVSWKDLKWNDFYACNGHEALLRALGKARRAAVRIPCVYGNYTHQYGKIEIDRFAIFNRLFMPEPDIDLSGSAAPENRPTKANERPLTRP
jgi:hypothetical protein